MDCSIKSIGIIGYGRFGSLVYRLLAERLSSSIEFRIYNLEPAEIELTTFARAASADIVIPCVPIKAFKSVISDIAGHVKPGSLVLDVCSVKIHPRAVMLDTLPESVSCIGMHPMFGPGTYQKRLESGSENPLAGLTVVIDRIRCSDDQYSMVIKFLKKQLLHAVEMTADEHDRLAARFQFICLTTAFILKKLSLERSSIDTESASLMLDYLEMISVDKQLVKDLYQYNPYCAQELRMFDGAFKEFITFLEDADS